MPTTEALVTRLRDPSGALLGFRIDGLAGPGSRGFSVVAAGLVPEFEGEQGWFELERVYAASWNFWRPVRWLGPGRPAAQEPCARQA